MPRYLSAILLALPSMVGCGPTTKSLDSSRTASPPVPRVIRTERPALSDSDQHREELLDEEKPLALRRHTEWTLDETAADSLSRIGAPAVPALVSSLRDADATRRLRAVKVLSRIGSDASSAVPFLVDSLRDPDPLVRKAAARALGQIGPDAAESVPALIELMQEAETSNP